VWKEDWLGNYLIIKIIINGLGILDVEDLNKITHASATPVNRAIQL
jgi:hypothetical protein